MQNIILAIETSCDETACALYDAKTGILDERVYSQWRRHAAYGGIVPEVAARDHLRRLLPMINDMQKHTTAKPEIIAYTRGPGLASALLVGATTAQTLATAWQLPIVAVNHLEGHLLSPLLITPPPEFPYIALLVSGGHSQLWLVQNPGRYKRLGETLDDAAGEAFDKVAILLGLGYPGGARLERLAVTGHSGCITLPSPAQNRYDFSFSGLKTAVRRIIGKHSPANIAAAFQQTVADGLVKQINNALSDTKIKRVAIVGGVAQNAHIASRLRELANAQSAALWQPKKQHCGDNAAMIAVAAAYQKRSTAGAYDIAPRWQPENLQMVAEEGLEPPTRGL